MLFVDGKTRELRERVHFEQVIVLILDLITWSVPCTWYCTNIYLGWVQSLEHTSFLTDKLTTQVNKYLWSDFGQPQRSRTRKLSRTQVVQSRPVFFNHWQGWKDTPKTKSLTDNSEMKIQWSKRVNFDKTRFRKKLPSFPNPNHIVGKAYCNFLACDLEKWQAWLYQH